MAAKSTVATVVGAAKKPFHASKTMDCDIVLSSDIRGPTAAELKAAAAGKGNFTRFRGTAKYSSYSVGPAMTGRLEASVATQGKEKQ